MNRLVNAGGLQPLLSLVMPLASLDVGRDINSSTDNERTVQLLAVGTIANLAGTASCRRPIEEAGGIMVLAAM